MTYGVLALVAFLIGVGILIFLVVRAREIGGAGLTGPVYYVVLIALGLASALVLFGILRARAIVRGDLPNVHVELGGAAAVFALVIWGGLETARPGGAFPYAVLLRGPSGKAAAIGGKLTILLDATPTTATVDGQGRAMFENVPPGFREQDVHVELEARGWAFASGRIDTTIRISGTWAMVRLKRGNDACCVLGVVRGEGVNGVVGATVTVDDTLVTTDALGRFKLVLKGDTPRESVTLTVAKPGYEQWSGTAQVDSTPAEIVLRRPRRP